MRRLSITFVVAIYVCLNLTAQESAQEQKMKWWREARLGMFIHGGPYAVLGGEYHGYLTRVDGPAWIMNRCKIPVSEYQEMIRTFNPVKYEPDKWGCAAKDAGMKYIIITAKHHDGFG